MTSSQGEREGGQEAQEPTHQDDQGQTEAQPPPLTIVARMHDCLFDVREALLRVELRLDGVVFDFVDDGILRLDHHRHLYACTAMSVRSGEFPSSMREEAHVLEELGQFDERRLDSRELCSPVLHLPKYAAGRGQPCAVALQLCAARRTKCQRETFPKLEWEWDAPLGRTWRRRRSPRPL